MDKWDNFYLGMARQAATGSKDPSTQVGAVICDRENRFVCAGFNGFPRGIKDDSRLEDRNVKYKLILHAEHNAILFSRRDLSGCTLYTWPFMPCSSCAAIIIQSGIKRVIAPRDDNPRWKESFELTEQLFKEAGVELLLFNRKLKESRNTEDREFNQASYTIIGGV